MCFCCVCVFSEGWTPGVHGREVFHAWIQVKESRTVQFFLFVGVSQILASWLGLELLIDSCGFASSFVSPLILSFSVTKEARYVMIFELTIKDKDTIEQISGISGI